MVVEKVSYDVNWKKFKRGYSIFIPCLDPPRARQEILEVTHRLRMQVLLKLKIEDGIQGFRIWRTS